MRWPRATSTAKSTSDSYWAAAKLSNSTEPERILAKPRARRPFLHRLQTLREISETECGDGLKRRGPGVKDRCPKASHCKANFLFGKCEYRPGPVAKYSKVSSRGEILRTLALPCWAIPKFMNVTTGCPVWLCTTFHWLQNKSSATL